MGARPFGLETTMHFESKTRLESVLNRHLHPPSTNTKMSSTVSSQDSLFASLLKPGSSLHPTFLRILDGAFATLLAIFITLLYLLSGNVHIVFLIIIELCLWASVKWYVRTFHC